MNSASYKKGSDEQVGKHFEAKEFDCPCAHCDRTYIDVALVKGLDMIRDDLGVPIWINSGYRCDRRQYELAKLGYEVAKGISTHQVGKAADIQTGKHTGEELEMAARRCGFTSVGRGRTWIHCDTRPGVRSWNYLKR